MSGTISLGPGRHWIIKLWIWNSIRRSMALYSKSAKPELAELFVSDDVDALVTVNLESLNQERFNCILQIMSEVFEGYVRQGSVRFTDTGGYADLLRRFSELKCLMYCDPRAGLPTPQLGTVILSSREWQAPSWIFDAVIEQMAALLAVKDMVFSNQLFSSRLGVNKGYVDLRDISSEQMTNLRQSAEFLRAAYAGHASDCYTDPETFNRLKPHFLSFSQFLTSG